MNIAIPPQITWFLLYSPVYHLNPFSWVLLGKIPQRYNIYYVILFQIIIIQDFSTFINWKLSRYEGFNFLILPYILRKGIVFWQFRIKEGEKA